MGWYPCESPERPNDGSIRWHDDCRGCHVAAIATARRWPDDPVVKRLIPSIVDRTRPRSGDGFFGRARALVPLLEASL